MEKYYEVLALLAELAGEYGANTYSVTDFAFGFIPFKNGENKAKEVGVQFTEVAHWLLNESEENFKSTLKEEK